jgi:hypothetical protein
MLSKENLTGGTADDFKTFIENKTGKSVQSVR